MRLLIIEDASGVDVTWDLSTSTWTFSDGNHVAQAAGTGVYNVQTSTGKSGGKRYVEIKWQAITVTFDSTIRHDCGIGTSATPSFGGSDARDALGYNRDGTIFPAGSNGSAVSASDTVRFAFDITGGKAWIAISAGAWIGGGDPETDTTPTRSGLAAATYYPTASYEAAGANYNTYEIAASAARCDYSLPAGYSYWGDA
jgi:hypothetical protein